MYQFIETLLEKAGFWTILGVIIGFLLGECSRCIRELIKRWRLKSALWDELDTNLHLIDQKKDILCQMIQALEQKNLLSGVSVHSASTIYLSQVAVLSEFVKPVQRDNLHTIYEHLRVNDKLMDEFESRFKKDVDMGIMTNPWGAHKTQLTELFNSYNVTQDLIKDFLLKKPRDVFNRFKKK